MALRGHVCRLLTKLPKKWTKKESKYLSYIWNIGRPRFCTSAYAMMSAGVLAQVPWLTNAAPAFGIAGKNVEVIHEPQEFYNTLKEEASKAKHRIVLSSLYIGTSSLEKDLVEVIHNSLKCNGQLEVQILLDYTRGSRGEHNSRTLLIPLLKDFPDRVSISLYHTPDLRGVWKTLMPERYNETVGVQHMKVYMFDNNLIMSGANLSESYFTNRQDRYTLLRHCPHLCDFFHDLVSTVASMSFQLAADNSVHLLPDLDCHPYSDADGGEKYRKEMKHRVESVMDPQWYEDFAFFPENFTVASSRAAIKTTATSDSAKEVKRFTERRKAKPAWTSSDKCDTWVFPLVQMGPFRITQDERVTTELFRQLPEGSVVHLASGYFNLTDHYMNTIVQHSKAQYEILTASPKANGFYGGAGVSGYIPCAYTYIAKAFDEQVRSTGQAGRIHLYEYTRAGWTFHGKGLWCYLPGQHWPSFTLVGSPNFGFRSIYRDIEAQTVIVTENEHLQKQLYQEQQALYSPAEEVSEETFTRPERLVPLWAKIVTKYLIRNYF